MSRNEVLYMLGERNQCLRRAQELRPVGGSGFYFLDACEDGGHAAVVSATGNCASVAYSGACSSDDTLCYNNAAVSSISSALWATFAHEVAFTSTFIFSLT